MSHSLSKWINTTYCREFERLLRVHSCMALRPVLGQFNPVSTFTTFYFRFILMLSSFLHRVVSSLQTFRLKLLCQFLLSLRFLPCQLNIAVKSIALLFVYREVPVWSRYPETVYSNTLFVVLLSISNQVPAEKLKAQPLSSAYTQIHYLRVLLFGAI